MNLSALLGTDFLAAVEAQLDSALRPGGESVESKLVAATRHLCLGNGAKRVRPRLVQLLGQAVDASPDDLVDVAVAGELIHSGSLLHDDVIDDGQLRRGRPTANVRWDNLTAVLAGDLCLTLAFVQIRRHPEILTSEAVDTIAAMTRAAMLEAEARGNINLDDVSWRRFVEGKTGALFAWCGRSAAHLVGSAEAVERFSRFGAHIGVAFQLTDDVLDLVGGSKKDRFSDLRNREPSYPVLRASAESPELRARIERAWARESVDTAEATELGHVVLKTSAVAQSVDAIAAEVEAALGAFGPYSDTAGCEEVAWWARSLVERARGGSA